MRITESGLRRIVREEIIRESVRSGTLAPREARRLLREADAKSTITGIGSVVSALRAAGNKELADIIAKKDDGSGAIRVTLKPTDSTYKDFNVYLGSDTDTMPLNAGKGFVTFDALMKATPPITIEK